ncbi:MAG: RES domain-containing protein [Pacificimonas sp.]
MHRKRVRATVVRAVRPYRAPAPASGEGAALRGRRFNPVGTPALYTSFSFETCAREVRFGSGHDPYTFLFLKVDSADIADLTDPGVRDIFGIADEDIACPNWEDEMTRGSEPASHSLALRLIDLSYAGIVVPSFAKGARSDDLNLVMWTWIFPTSWTARPETP